MQDTRQLDGDAFFVELPLLAVIVQWPPSALAAIEEGAMALAAVEEEGVERAAVPQCQNMWWSEMKHARAILQASEALGQLGDLSSSDFDHMQCIVQMTPEIRT